jgi:uncharacterized protein with von Willebrand factor type A (vWA) domain
MTNTVLYDLFQEIRSDKQWIAPGLEEYFLLMSLLKDAQYPITNFDSLAFVLETIWLKSHQHKDKFRALLEKRRTALVEMAADMHQTFNTNTKDAKKEELKPKDLSPIPEDLKKEEKKEGRLQNETPTKDEAEQKTKQDIANKTEVNNLQSQSGTISFSLNTQATHTGKAFQMQLDAAEKKPILQTAYSFTNDYFPVKSRQLQQAWRLLKNKQDGPDTMEISIPKTIAVVAKNGFFNQFAFQKQMINHTRLFIFTDQAETMMAEEAFGKELAQAALENGIHNDTENWYFHKVPEYMQQKSDYAVTNADWTKKINLAHLFKKIAKKNIAVLIYSDAGALLGELDEERIDETIKFVKDLLKRTAYTVWVNPAPKSRWRATNAEAIAQFVPMFETHRTDLENAITTLKGKLLITSLPQKDVTS